MTYTSLPHRTLEVLLDVRRSVARKRQVETDPKRMATYDEGLKYLDDAIAGFSKLGAGNA